MLAWVWDDGYSCTFTVALPRDKRILVRDYLCTLFEMNFPLCPVVGLLGNKRDQVTSKELQHLLDLAFLSVKQIILINWKGRKLTCFKIDNWQ